MEIVTTIYYSQFCHLFLGKLVENVWYYKISHTEFLVVIKSKMYIKYVIHASFWRNDLSCGKCYPKLFISIIVAICLFFIIENKLGHNFQRLPQGTHHQLRWMYLSWNFNNNIYWEILQNLTKFKNCDKFIYNWLNILYIISKKLKKYLE